MKQTLILTILLTCFWSSHAQTPEALVRDVKAHATSVSELKTVLQKHAFSRDTDNHWFVLADTNTYLNHQLLFDCFRYDNRLVFLRAVYKNDKVAYLLLDSQNYTATRSNDDTLFKYVDLDYTTNILAAYNRAHQTDFTWQDLYEDELTRWVDGLPELLEPLIDRNVATEEDGEMGRVRIEGNGPPYATTLFRPLLLKRNHAAIVRSARSFNPVRKAYGGYCLFILEIMGERLSDEEKQLFSTISQSKEIITVNIGCFVRKAPISSLFTKQELEGFANVFKDFKSGGGQF